MFVQHSCLCARPAKSCNSVAILPQICFQPDKEEFKEFLRWLGKFIIRTNPSLQSKEQKKRQKSTESDDDNANKQVAVVN